MTMFRPARTKIVEPSFPLSQRIRATSRQWPGPTFLLRGTQRKLKRPLARTRRCAIGTEFWALRTDTRTVREQNSITGQPLPLTVWTAVVRTVDGEAEMLRAAWAGAAAVAASPARTTAVRVVAVRTGSMVPQRRKGLGAFPFHIARKSANPPSLRVLHRYIACGIYNHQVMCTPMSATFEVLAEPARRQILELLRQRERPVGELVERLSLSQPGVSKHLRVLRDAGLVRVRPEGQRRWYGLRAEPLAELDAWLAPYRELWGGRLDALERHLDEQEAP